MKREQSNASQLFWLLSVCACLSVGYILSHKDCPEPIQCTQPHYLDSTQYYVTKSSLTIKPQPTEYVEIWDAGVYKLK